MDMEQCNGDERAVFSHNVTQLAVQPRQRHCARCRAQHRARAADGVSDPMEDTRVVLDVGGRAFATSTTTLRASGAGYFAGLLGETGAAMPAKRSRSDGGAVGEYFIDRDPDTFVDVLSFMRTGCLPAATARDRDRLADVRVEAMYFRINTEYVYRIQVLVIVILTRSWDYFPLACCTCPAPVRRLSPWSVFAGGAGG